MCRGWKLPHQSSAKGFDRIAQAFKMNQDAGVIIADPAMQVQGGRETVDKWPKPNALDKATNAHTIGNALKHGRGRNLECVRTTPADLVRGARILPIFQ